MKNKVLAVTVLAVAFTYFIGICNICCVSAAQKSSSASKGSEKPDVTSETAIVADAETGYIYYNKGIHTQMYPASITKILTGLVAVEKCADDEKFSVTEEATKGITRDYANIALEPGEEITMEEALYTMFLASANDSASAIAVHTAGSIPAFVELMNKKCKELGADDSNFSNANGMPDKNNKTSAYDMALITQAALKNTRLMKYFGALNYTMPKTNFKNQTVQYCTLHKMMKNTYYRYDGVIAGKTGYEMMSGHTLVTVAKKEGRTLICVVMKSAPGNACYRDTKALLDYGFAAVPGDSNAEFLVNPTPKTAENSVTSDDTMNDKALSSLPDITAKPVSKTPVASMKVCAMLTLAMLTCFFTLGFSIVKNRTMVYRSLQRKILVFEKAERDLE